MPSRPRLNTIPAVRRELARVYGQAERGTRDVSDASKLANMLMILAKLLEAG